MTWVRRSMVVVGVAALAFVAAGAAGAGGASERANRRVAHRAAAQLLAHAVLPTGATPSAGEPAGDHRYLSRPGQVPAAVNLVDRHRWWTVPEDESIVSAFVDAHQPKGTRSETEGVGDGVGFTTNSLTFELPSVGRSLGTRWLAVAMITLPGDQTGVRVDAEVQWLVPRPAAERIPRDARFLKVTVRRPPGPSTSDVSVTSRAKIRRIASLINELNTAQPGAIDCTGEADDPVVTFTFRSADGGHVLARARQVLGQDTRVAVCEPMTLSIHGRAQAPLLGGVRVVRAAQRLLGIHLARSAAG